MTFIEMQFENGARVMWLHWKGEDLFAYGGSSIPEPSRVICLPDSTIEDRLVSYHLPSGRRVFGSRQVSRSVDSDEITV